MSNFLMQVIVWAVIGLAVFLLCRAMRCKPTLVTLASPKTNAIRAIVAVCLSATLLFLFILRHYLVHGPRQQDFVPTRPADLVGPLIGLVLFVLPAAVFMFKNRDPLISVGLTTRNLWQATAIGTGLAFLTFFFQPGSLASKVRNFQWVAVCYYVLVGFQEEFLFRGYLQTRLIAWLGKWQGWVLASVIMAMVHLPHRLLIEGKPFGSAIVASASLVPVSALMGFIMLQTGNLVAPGMFHTFANLVSTLNRNTS